MSIQCNMCGEITLGPNDLDKDAAIQDMGWICPACQPREKRVTRLMRNNPKEFEAIVDIVKATMNEVWHEAYSEGIVEGLILAAEAAPAVHVRLKDLLQALEQNNAPTLEGSRYMATAIRNALTDAGVVLC